MDKKKNIIILVVIVSLLFCNFVSAASIQFIDAAYVGNGTLSVTDAGGNQIGTLENSSLLIEVNNESAYMLDYQPRGLYSLDQEQFFSWNDGNWTGPNFGAAHFYIAWFSHLTNIVNFLWMCICIVMVLLA